MQPQSPQPTRTIYQESGCIQLNFSNGNSYEILFTTVTYGGLALGVGAELSWVWAKSCARLVTVQMHIIIYITYEFRPKKQEVQRLDVQYCDEWETRSTYFKVRTSDVDRGPITLVPSLHFIGGNIRAFGLYNFNQRVYVSHEDARHTQVTTDMSDELSKSFEAGGMVESST